MTVTSRFCLTRGSLALALCGALLAGCQLDSNSASSTGGGSGPTVEVAANLPLTGDLATYGSSVHDGAELAVEDLAKKEGSPKINFDWQDNASDPKQAVSIWQKQSLQNPAIYVSGVKPQYMAIKDQINSKGIPHFAWVFDAFINPTGTKNNFRTWVSYKIEPPVYLDYVKRKKAKRVAVIYVQLPHTVEEFEKIVVPGLKAQGITAIDVEPFPFGTKDFKDLAAKVQAFKPDVTILNGFQNDLVSLVRAMRPIGLIKDGNLISTYDMLDASTVLGPDETEGIRLVAPVFVTQPDKPGLKEWRDRFTAKYNKPPLYTNAFAYDMVSIIADAAKRVGPNPDNAKWIDALRATSIQGVTGPLKFDDTGDLITPLEVGVFKNGKPVPDNQS